ncbi:helix-turn-helix domain-containing protein [Pseudoscardovia suis]|jgi:transcriptional regulator with XRE-family HTH domain|uniref:helix-turn-helix domain-containing protein n=1 Tax=Pseudoscardovia suis TaxID=987063 RepID=UPI003F9443D1|nr:helix-turn-helix transcriptional regulator [Bifidobacteriaceae bacterium]
MCVNFGTALEAARKAKGKTLRSLATDAGIAPAFLSDIEKGHRYPPTGETLERLIHALNLTEEEESSFYDLAAADRGNVVSADLHNYIMENAHVRAALRFARDTQISDDDWKHVIALLEEQKNKEQKKSTRE